MTTKLDVHQLHDTEIVLSRAVTKVFVSSGRKVDNEAYNGMVDLWANIFHKMEVALADVAIHAGDDSS